MNIFYHQESNKFVSNKIVRFKKRTLFQEKVIANIARLTIYLTMKKIVKRVTDKWGLKKMCPMLSRNFQHFPAINTKVLTSKKIWLSPSGHCVNLAGTASEKLHLLWILRTPRCRVYCYAKFTFLRITKFSRPLLEIMFYGNAPLSPPPSHLHYC